MVDYEAPLYQHPQEEWDAAKCAKLARRRITDAFGTKGPVGQLMSGELGHYVHGMKVRYNGGTSINGEWWQGEEWQLPRIPTGFDIIHVCNWGYRMVKT